MLMYSHKVEKRSLPGTHNWEAKIIGDDLRAIRTSKSEAAYDLLRFLPGSSRIAPEHLY